MKIQGQPSNPYDQFIGKTVGPDMQRVSSLQSRLDDLNRQLVEAQAAKPPPDRVTNKGMIDRGSGMKKKNENLANIRKQIAEANSQMTQAQAGSDKNPDGSFKRPEFASMIDPQTGLLRPEYTLEYEKTALDTRGLDQFRNEAMRKAGEDSAWSKMMIGREDLNRQANLDKLMQDQRTGLMGAYDNLAAQGGLGGGARERIARGGIKDLLVSRQGIRRDSQGNVMNVRLQDEENRLKMLGQLPGMELSKSNFDMQNQENMLRAKEYNQRGALDEINRLRNDQLAAWKTNMEQWGAGKTADAQARAARGGKK